MVVSLFLELKVCCRSDAEEEAIRDHQLSRQSAI